ncbi:MAG: alpha/beta hydrolase [Chloroflexota bacterium]
MSRSVAVPFQAGDLRLAGTLQLPEAEAVRHPWVLLLPSFGPRDRDGGFDRDGHPGWFADRTDGDRGLLARLAGALAEVGVASFRYDPRGCGASEGSWEASDLFSRIDDARDAVAAMRSHGGLDLRRSGVVAHGEGALLGISLTIGDPVLSAMTLIGAPARSVRDVMRRGAAERARTGTDCRHPFVAALDGALEELVERARRHEADMPLVIAGRRHTIGLAAWRQAFDTPGLALGSMLHRSVTLVHGDDDAWVDPEESELLASVLRAGGNDPGLRRMPGCGHDLAEASGADLLSIAGDLADRLVPHELPPVLLAIEGEPPTG